MARPTNDIAILGDDELAVQLEDLIRDDGRIDREELTIRCRDGEVSLEGTLPSEGEHEVLLDLLRDRAGVERIVDRLQVERVPWERRDRAPGIDAQQPDDEIPSDISQETAATSEPLEAIEEGTPYTPPDGPVPIAHRRPSLERHTSEARSRARRRPGTPTLSGQEEKARRLRDHGVVEDRAARHAQHTEEGESFQIDPISDPDEDVPRDDRG